MIKVARQAKLITALQQTKLVKIWLRRQELVAQDRQQQEELDEEAAAIAELEAEFEVAGGTAQNNRSEAETPQENSENLDLHGRRSWQCVKARVPAYNWDLADGEEAFVLKDDTFPSKLKEGQTTWWYDLALGGRNRIRLDFPLHLWSEIGTWWQKLRWGPKLPGHLNGVFWLELLVDFELSTGVDCKQPQLTADWGKRAELLRSVLKLILKVRSPVPEALAATFGASRRISSLAPFGFQFLGGLTRRVTFVSKATPKGVAVNAWQWAEEGKCSRPQLN